MSLRALNQKSISSIGLGCVTFGREIDLQQSFAMMDYAMENGVNLFDTASSYSDGGSEEAVGAWLSSRRPESEKIWIATKCLPPYSPERMRSSVEKSLKRLKIDSIDVFYLHSWDPAANNEHLVITLDQLVKEGKVRFLGASNFTGEQLRDVVSLQRNLGLNRVRFAQNNHNFAVSDLTDELRKVCSINGISIISYSPLGAGFLTGKYSNGVGQGTRFDIIPGHQNIYFNNLALEKLEKLKKIAASTGHSLVNLALAWALHQDGVESVLIGGRKPDHLKQAFEAETFYDQAIFSQMAAALTEH
jgi:aryl-alcohol dehydrogenase-like predicted oxidoreductase